MSYRKFNKSFLIATVIALGAIAGIQGCSSDDPQESPPAAGSSSKAGGAGKAGESQGEAGEAAGGKANNGGSGNTEAGAPSDAGAAGEAGAPPVGTCDHFLIPCEDDGVTCETPFDNSKLTKLVNGQLPALP